MLVKISDHLKKLSKISPAVEKEFCPSVKEKICSKRAMSDPLLEDEYSPIKGLAHKYPKRVLVMLTMACASYCRFCTRRRKVSDLKKGLLAEKDIDNMVDYFKKHRDINEVIFSGGDPLMAPKLLDYAVDRFVKLKQIKIVRLHTRVPVSDPRLLTPKIIRILSKIKKQPLYLSIHLEHPDELTPDTVKAISRLRGIGAILLSQTVFLRGINDSYPILKELFIKLTELGIRPYYIYHCDLVKGIEHFIVPIKKEVEIMSRLRKDLSGIAFPFHLVDTPGGSGKIPVPLNYWKCDYHEYFDFKGKRIKMH